MKCIRTLQLLRGDKRRLEVHLTKIALIKHLLTLVSVSSTCCSYIPGYISCISFHAVNGWPVHKIFSKTAFGYASQKKKALRFVTPPESSLCCGADGQKDKFNILELCCLRTLCVAWSLYLHSKYIFQCENLVYKRLISCFWCYFSSFSIKCFKPQESRFPAFGEVPLYLNSRVGLWFVHRFIHPKRYSVLCSFWFNSDA